MTKYTHKTKSNQPKANHKRNDKNNIPGQMEEHKIPILAETNETSNDTARNQNRLLCTIVLLLNIMIIVTVSRLEFRENAMKISLMKIFGYSLFERHKTLLKMIVVENFVILVGMLIYSLLSVQTEVGISILVSSFMALIEFTIIFFNITIVEKTNIPKSLKGGCL